MSLILCRNSINFDLKQIMESVNDLFYNISSLKSLQADIDSLQTLKNRGQMQVNMAALGLLRHFILDEKEVGMQLFVNLIRRFYPLDDDQIVKYEKQLYEGRHRIVKNGKFEDETNRRWYYITNIHVWKRKGANFIINNRRFQVGYKGYRTTVNSYDMYTIPDLFYEMSFIKGCDFVNEIAMYGYNIDFCKEKYPPVFLAKNKFIKWNWDLISEMWDIDHEEYDWYWQLLDNDGFIAQMGINDIEDMLLKLQDVVGVEIPMSKKKKIIEKCANKRIALHSYLPISKEFIIQHYDELDWKIIKDNPYVQWDLDLINLFLKKVETTVSEPERAEYLNGSRAMYTAIELLLNDHVLSDIEKLYDITC